MCWRTGGSGCGTPCSGGAGRAWERSISGPWAGSRGPSSSPCAICSSSPLSPLCLALCWLFQHLPLDWLRRPLRLRGTYSLESYLLNISLFAEVPLLRRLVSFGPSNRLYYLLSYAANIALAVLLHRLAEGLRRAWSGKKETA